MSRTIADIAAALRSARLDGWLFYDFRRSDPIAYRVLGLPDGGISTRRWWCYVAADGTVSALVSAVEAHRLQALGAEATVYTSYHDMISGLRTILEGSHRIAMNYSPRGAIPYVSRVDAGALELVRSLNVEIVSAADLIARFESVLTAAQLEGHRRCGAKLGRVVEETFAEVARRISANDPMSEYSFQQFIIERIAAAEMVADEPPIVAVGAHSADPHYTPEVRDSAPIQRGDFLLIDLWAKEKDTESVYADITWTGFVGETVPAEHARIFEIVRHARDAAVALVEARIASREAVSGREADRAAREVIEQAGFGAEFVHRTGHSIGREVHGMGANLDSIETVDDRALIENTCFSVEPGIYLTGRFGVRSELNMTIENGRATVSAPVPQRHIVPILGRR